jgi:membrane protease YdiL (CAAX protease family)
MSNPSPPADAWRSFKGLLALLSLLLCLLLWLNGLLGSLERPSVGNALLLRQQELAVLAQPLVPPALAQPLLGADPRRQLRQELARQAASSALPLEQQRLWALLEQQGGDRELARQLQDGLAPPTQPQQGIAGSLQLVLACELSDPASPCAVPSGLARQALLRLLLITLAPALLMLLGGLLLLRQLWLMARRRTGPPAPLQGPALSLVDVTLLVAGGFVVVGELLTPLLVAPVLTRLLAPLASDPALQQAAAVPLLYLSLMVGPLALLAWLRSGLGPAPAAGWLQWRWQPWPQGLRLALAQLLMVLPVVALSGWLLERLWSDPSGSNPLLDMVLTTPSSQALLLLALTALVLAPLFEETLFRGVLLPVLARRWGRGWGVLLSAAAFALAHLSLGELLPLFVLGLGLGLLRLQSGRLGASVLMHGLWNGLTFANLLLLAG